MKTITRTLAKGSMATVAAGAMALASATPVFAQSYERDRDNGIGAGEIIAGAVILGGIAIAAGALGGSDRDRYDDRRYGYDRYARVDPRAAVQRCVAAVENNARRYGYRYANVTQIRNVNDNRNGFRVRGDLVVDGQQGYRGARYDRNDRRGYQRGDQGRFDCQVDYRGQVRGIDYNGIRGLR
jgi:hypothetical protein